MPNSDIHTKNTRSKLNISLPQTSLTKCQKRVYFAGIKMFNHLPENILKISLIAQKFKVTLTKLLLLGSFYSIEEFYEWISKII